MWTVMAPILNILVRQHRKHFHVFTKAACLFFILLFANNCHAKETPFRVNNVGSLIVGGKEAVPHSSPWQVAVEVETQDMTWTKLCGGSIITNRWILSAAHCCDVRNLENYQIIVGAHRLGAGRVNQNNMKTYLVSKVLRFYNYEPSRWSNDFCLLKTTQTITMNEHVKPVLLNSGKDLTDGAVCKVTGWGETEPQAPRATDSSYALREVTVNTLSSSACRVVYPRVFTADMLCAAAPGKDSCEGDSGGPLTCYVSGKRKQYGVVSFGIGCGNAYYPGVYAQTLYGFNWIMSMLAESSNTEDDFMLYNEETKLCAGVSMSSKSGGAEIVSWDCQIGNADQRWYWTDSSITYAAWDVQLHGRIRNKNSGMCLDGYYKWAYQYPCTGDDNSDTEYQRWTYNPERRALQNKGRQTYLHSSYRGYTLPTTWQGTSNWHIVFRGQAWPVANDALENENVNG